jgi:hypothetical protein
MYAKKRFNFYLDFLLSLSLKDISTNRNFHLTIFLLEKNKGQQGIESDAVWTEKNKERGCERYPATRRNDMARSRSL